MQFVLGILLLAVTITYDPRIIKFPSHMFVAFMFRIARFTENMTDIVASG